MAVGIDSLKDRLAAYQQRRTELDALAREDLKLLTRSGIAPDIVHPAQPEAAVGQGKDAARAVCLF